MDIQNFSINQDGWQLAQTGNFYVLLDAAGDVRLKIEVNDDKQITRCTTPEGKIAETETLSRFIPYVRENNWTCGNTMTGLGSDIAGNTHVIAALPAGITIARLRIFNNPWITELPAITVQGNCYLVDNPRLTTIAEGFTVEGNLSIEGCPISTLDGVSVQGKMDIQNINTASGVSVKGSSPIKIGNIRTSGSITISGIGKSRTP